MNAIVGLTYILSKNANDPTLIAELNKIDVAANHLLSIINDILDISKIDAGQLELEHIDFSLEKLFANLLTLVTEQANAKHLILETAIDYVPVWLNGDPMRLTQAILNYLANAIKFTAHGRVKLSAQLVQQRPSGLLIKFSVQDTGIGIAENQRSVLFDAFTQADVSTTRKFGGTGLGLNITRALAQLMHGEVGVESTPNQGSTFWFTALLQPATQGERPEENTDTLLNAETTLRKEYRGTHILLVEDNAINQEVATAILERVGLSVDKAENGRIALDKIQQHNYALVLMDVHMPEMDGLEATKAIRQLPGKQDLPIIAMTANAFEEDKIACIAAGMNDFTSKPVIPTALYATILQWLRISVGQE
jgi:CheY-like chemotaxis protein